MPAELKAKLQVVQLGDQQVVTEDNVHHFTYKNLSLKNKLNTSINKEYVKQHIQNKEFIFHPFWVAKTLIVAERPPFPPKKTPNVIFVDAVSGYRGVFSKIPGLHELEVDEDQLVEMKIDRKNSAHLYIKDVQEKQINRSYILKKPKHEVLELLPVYLPMWKVTVQSEFINDTVYINANTGESEKYLSERWYNRKDLLL
ncbi:hypothetical protein [Alkalibacillus aidingensis]|uniref:hypothetical protein n=1 Tax=Alkalibacillus aidingensis TaxID=2747607 RepID=UPI0016603FA3|nr:hypothetical protein [Alkalibacillus aidingensis]